MKNIEEEEQNTNLLKLEVQDKYDRTDLALLTKMSVTIPMTAQDLMHQLRNLAAVAGRCLGQDSIVYGSLLKIQEHTETHEMRYQFEFNNDYLFGSTFLDKINWRICRFLESCAHGTVSKIKKSWLKFDDIME